MKKYIILLFTIAMSAMVLSACSNGNANTDDTLSTNQYSNEQRLPQGALVDTNANQSTNQSANEQALPSDFDIDINTSQNTNEQSLPQETLAGVVQSIDGMTLTIDASQVFMVGGTPGGAFGETTEHIFNPNDAAIEKQEITIRLTEQTAIVVRTNAGGQIIGERIGTIDDLSMHNIVMAEGEWQGDEFIASELITIGF